MDVDASLPHQENARAAEPPCPSAPSQGHCWWRLKAWTTLFKLLSNLVISKVAQVFPTLPQGSFSVVQSDSPDCEEAELQSSLCFTEAPKCVAVTRKAQQKSCLTINEIISMKTTETSQQSCPCQWGMLCASCCMYPVSQLERDKQSSWSLRTIRPPGLLWSSLCLPHFSLFQAEKPSSTWMLLCSQDPGPAQV